MPKTMCLADRKPDMGNGRKQLQLPVGLLQLLKYLDPSRDHQPNFQNLRRTPEKGIRYEVSSAPVSLTGGKPHLYFGQVDSRGKLKEILQLLTPLEAGNVHQHRARGICHICHVPAHHG